MRDQWAALTPGEKLPGLPSRPWNAILGRLRPDLTGDGADLGPTSPAEVLVANNTGAALNVYGVVGLDEFNPFPDGPDEWKRAEVLAGGVPAAGSAVAVVQQGLRPAEVGRARLAGRAVCKVDLTNLGHLYAAPLAGSTDHLASAAAGPVRIVALEHDWGATGVQWATVLLIGAAAGSAPFVRFTLTQELTPGLGGAMATVDGSWGGGPNVGAWIGVDNLPASTGFVFAGVVGHKGLATYDPGAGGKWWIVQMECSPGAGGGAGGAGGFTGTIGN